MKQNVVLYPVKRHYQVSKADLFLIEMCYIDKIVNQRTRIRQIYDIKVRISNYLKEIKKPKKIKKDDNGNISYMPTYKDRALTTADKLLIDLMNIEKIKDYIQYEMAFLPKKFEIRQYVDNLTN